MYLTFTQRNYTLMDKVVVQFPHVVRDRMPVGEDGCVTENLAFTPAPCCVTRLEQSRVKAAYSF